MRWNCIHPMVVRTLARLVLLSVLCCGPPASAASSPHRIILATPGQGNVSHLPIDLIKKIGADQAEGVELTVRYFPGGPLAFKDMLDRNADFAVAGAPALAALRVNGEPVKSIATVNRVPTFVLMVRRALHGKVKRVADLRGRVIGINTSSAKSKSTSQQVAEFLLRRAGVDLDQVHFVPAGQSLADQLAAVDSGAVDAIMGDEPFATDLQASGKVYKLVDLHDLQTARAVFGGLFLNAQLSTREDILRTQPDKAERMVKVLRRTLRWIESHTPEQIVSALEITDPTTRSALLAFLRRNKAIYSPDGSFSEEQVRTAERFFRLNNTGDARAAQFDFDALIDPRWAGKTP